MDGPKLPFVDNLKFDPSLKLSDENFALKLKDGTRMERRSKEKRMDCVIGYPEPLVFARFASAAYQEWGKNESSSDYEKRLNLPKVTNENLYQHSFKIGWRLLTTATGLALKGTIYGYFGAAYWQPARRRVVIAHRGTVIAFDGMKLKNLDAVRADLMGIIANKYVKQMDAACTFADKIRNAVEKVELELQTTFEIFFTGHSLGAWLAQVTTFSLKYLTLVKGAFVKNKVDGYHAHTVVFDSPGCKMTIERMIEDLDVRHAGKSTDAASLDITSYLSSPNFVNCCNPHVGKLYRVYPKIKSHDYVSYTESSHSMDAILETFQTSLPFKEVVDWPQIEINLWQWKIWKIRGNILGNEYRDFFQFATDQNDYDPKAEDIRAEFEFTDKNDEKLKRFVSVRYQTKAARSNECAFNVFNHYELEFIQRFQELKYIPNCVLDGENISEEHRTKIVDNLNNFIINSKEKTIRCEADINRLIPYVKMLLRLYPDLHGFEIRNQIYIDITEKYRRKMKRITSVLLPCDWPDFVHFLDNEISICHVLAQYGTDSAMAKIFKVIETKAPRFTFFAFELQNLETTETFFHMTEFLKSSEKLSDVLIAIECKCESFRNEENFLLVKKLQQEVKNNPINTKLVLITYLEDKDKFNPEDNSVSLYHDGITWHELTYEARMENMSKNLIRFQGNPEKISLQNFIRRPFMPSNLNELGDIVDPETIMKLLKGEDIDVGPKIQTLVDFYIPRKFNPHIEDEVVHNERNGDVLEFLYHNRDGLDHYSSTVRRELADYWSSSVVWYRNRELNWNLHHNNIQDESLEYSVETVLENFQKYSKKTFIISEVPGMGKSTVLAFLAENMKNRTPSNWVILVNLNECAKTLKDAVKNKTKLNNHLEVAKFLSENILACSENTNLRTPFERKLFQKSLISYGGIVLIFDAFDEISPDYEEIVIRLLQLLRETRVEALLLSTRPHTKDKLEHQLGTLSHTMVPFSRDDQKRFLTMFWEKQLNLEEIGQIDLLKRANECVDQLEELFSTEEGDFLGIPLQCQFLADYTVDKIKNGQNLQDLKELSLMNLYEAFDRRKINIYQDEKNSKAEAEIMARLDKGVMKTLIRQAHREYALRLLLSRQKWDELEYPEVEENQDDIETAIQKVGLMLKTGDIPQFVHRTLADFYVLDYAFYLAKNSKKNERKLAILSRETLLQPQFGVLRILLDGLIRYGQKWEETSSFLRSFAQIMAHNWTMDKTLCLNGNGDTVFHVLLSSKNYSLFDALLNMLNEVCSEESLKSLMETPGSDSLLALHIASSQGHHDSVNNLVNNGANINGLDKQGNTPLLVATKNGHLEIAKILFEKGAIINSSCNNGLTPIYVASSNGDLDIVRFLFEKGADINSSNYNGTTPIIAASENGHLKVVCFLLGKYADINSSNNNGATPIIVASENGHLDVVRFLLEKYADINSIDNFGRTPLIVVSQSGYLEVVRFLLDNGADINISDKNGLNPINAASWEGHQEIVRYLFENGADINSCSNNAVNPIIAASFNGHLEIVRYLLENGADISFNHNNHGMTPLLAASSNRHLKVVLFLIGNGADISVLPNDDYQKIVQLLLENGTYI